MKNNRPHLRPRYRSYMQRSVDELPARQRFLIVCEGEKTEPLYFQGFRNPGLVVNVEGRGLNTLGLVQEAIKLLSPDKYDQTWCVFDKDDFPDKNFNQAISLALKNGIKVAYSNQSFELWYVLHFIYMQNAITRNDYMRILDEKLPHKYEKNSTTIYKELLDKQMTAILNATRLLDLYQPSRPAKDDPSTTVHKLVEELIKYSRPFKSR